MGDVALTLQAIFQACYASVEGSHPLPDYVREAARCLMHCRTAAMGGHKRECPDGHVVRCFYNSCRHRFCPRCQYRQLCEWLRKQQARLLRCPYHHLTFTFPDKLNGLRLANVERMTDLLFKAVRDTLFELLSELVGTPVTPGFLACLHTWGQAKVLHPHLHVLLTDGGLNGDGRWCGFGDDPVLQPTRLMERFRDLFLKSILREARADKLTLPGRMTLAKLERLVERLYKPLWSVHQNGPLENPDAVLEYLGSYLRGAPISDRRLVSFDGKKVTFLWRDNRKAKPGQRAPLTNMTLPVGLFIRRVLLHVPPPGAHWCRSFGLFAHGKKRELDWARALLGQRPVEPVAPIDWSEVFADREDLYVCPVCGQRLKTVEEWGPGRAPPALDDDQDAAA